MKVLSHIKLEALGQFIPPPRHVYQCRRLANQYEIMSFNHFPYIPIVMNPENNPYIKTVIRIATRIYYICSMTHCQPSLKISYKSVRKFLRKVANNQTTTTTSLAEAMTRNNTLNKFHVNATELPKLL